MGNLLQNLLKKDRPSINVAIDIGSASLKMVVLSKKEGVIKLENFLVRPIIPTEDLADTIKKSWNQLGVNVKKASTSLNADGVILRYVYMPRMNKEELNSSISFEASKYIPMALENAFLDSAILKSDCPENKMFVLIAAINKNILDQRLKLFKDCGIGVRLVDVDCLAAINAFNYFYYSALKKEEKEKDYSAILDIGAGYSTLSILQDQIPYFTRSMAIAGDELDKRISAGLNIKIPEAKKIKESLSVAENSEALSIINGAINDLIDEARASFDYFENHFNTSVKKIFLLGNGAKTFGLKEAFAKNLGIEVLIPDISAGVLVEERLRKQLQENAASLTVALGLGLRDD